MAELGYFFTSAAGDRKYTAADFADLFNQLAQRQSGVIRGLDNTLALSNNGTLSVDVNTGVAQKAGYLYQNTAAMNIALDAVTSGSKRIDRVVIRVDLTARQVVATVLKGVESGTPSAPAITGSTDILLGKILLDRSSGSYAYTVTDERTYSDALLAPAIIKKFNENTFSLDDLVDGVSFKRVTADAVGTGNKIDLSKTGFLGKTLDNIADTATWKKVAAAVATALNAGTYDAASVSAYGIGAIATAKNNQDMNDLTTPGIHNLTGTLTNGPTDATLNSRFGCMVLKTDINTIWQVLFTNNTTGTFPNIWARNYDAASHVGWGSWYKFWNTWNDGNGGQPPAPKPRSAAGAGNLKLAEWDGANTKVPAGGQWIVFNYDQAEQQWNTPAFFSGGTSLTSSNIPAKYLCWRIAE